ncbi:hypothetical protein H9Q69_002205 [Fusarium xylarioides]|uniref:CHAT domain-containing protein n=1 Tax=Fusarium xylarioides TaxID=221167 RepID=A0A9P7I0M4_9HYPO|nr:hypothetical protein H9Q72_002578 [Fusarium xylarioides]KAG5798797.1 hypothetical protein H9Q69_002205 [Fusarium xylarioides]
MQPDVRNLSTVVYPSTELMFSLFKKSQENPEHTASSIELAQQALSVVTQDHDVTADFFNGLGCLYFFQYWGRRDMFTLKLAVETMQRAEKSLPSKHPHNAVYLSVMSNHLHSLFMKEGHIPHLELAISKGRQAVAICPDHPQKIGFIHNLGVLYETLYQTAQEDITKRISWAKDLIGKITENHPTRARHLLHLSCFLGERFRKQRLAEGIGCGDLDEAVTFASQAVEAAKKSIPPEQPAHFSFAQNLAIWLGERFQTHVNEKDLTDLINHCEYMFAISHRMRVDTRAGIANDLAVWYVWKHKTQRIGQSRQEPKPIDQAIRYFQNAMKLSTPGSECQMGYVSNYVDALRLRFEEKTVGLVECEINAHPDLEEAVSVGYQALEKNPQHSWRLKSLSSALGRRYQQYGNPEDIEKAIGLEKDSRPHESHFEQASRLNNLALFHGWRFERQLGNRDIEEAVFLAQKSLSATAKNSYDWATRNGNLGMWFGQQYSVTGILTDLNHAILHAGEALKAIPCDDTRRPRQMNNLAIWLGWKYDRWTLKPDEIPKTRAIKYLDDGIDLLEKACELAPDGHTDHIRSLNNLGKLLTWRFKELGHDDDIVRAIEVGQKAVSATPQQHGDRSRHLSNLADMYRLQGPDKNDAYRASIIKMLKEIMALDSSPPTHRINAVLENTSWLEDIQAWSDLSFVTESAVRLLPLASTRLVDRMDQHDILRRYTDLSSLAVASALEAGKSASTAIRLSESGRAIISGRQLNTRSDLTDLREAEPQLAEDFERLRNELDSPEKVSSFSTESAVSRVSHLNIVNRRLGEKVEEIRKVKGFENFLNAPSIEDLQLAAGPHGKIILINVSFRSDAFIISKDDITVCSLRRELRRELQQQTKNFSPRDQDISTTLSWLWDAIADPVLQRLGITETHWNGDVNSWPHICWIPTGLLCLMPLHAAGYHFDGSERTVLDRVVSSYSPSVKAILYTRQNVTRRAMRAPKAYKRAVLVSMPVTEGFWDLPFAEGETRSVEKVLRQRSSVLCERPNPPHRESVIEALPGCEYFHFAGHGVTDKLDPSQSGMLLRGGMRLTVSHLSETKLYQNPSFLAYLSACSTGRNRDEKLQDEGIHLIGACQLAGFQNVIGTLWAVSDEKCLTVARDVYKRLTAENSTSRSVANALHTAVRRLRDDDESYGYGTGRGELVYDSGAARTRVRRPDLWAAYIHTGFC